MKINDVLTNSEGEIFLVIDDAKRMGVKQEFKVIFHWKIIEDGPFKGCIAQASASLLKSDAKKIYKKIGVL